MKPRKLPPHDHHRHLLIPPYKDLAADPQLAAVFVLEAALEATILCLAALHPELSSGQHRPRPELLAAANIIELARALRRDLQLYNLALSQERERGRSEDRLFPF